VAVPPADRRRSTPAGACTTAASRTEIVRWRRRCLDSQPRCNNRLMSTDQTERVGVEAVRHALRAARLFIRSRCDRTTASTSLSIPRRMAGPQGDSSLSRLNRGELRRRRRRRHHLPREQEHIEYWLRYSLPVIVSCTTGHQCVTYWQAVSADTAESTGKGWKMTVLGSQILDEEALALWPTLQTCRSQSRFRQRRGSAVARNRETRGPAREPHLDGGAREVGR